MCWKKALKIGKTKNGMMLMFDSLYMNPETMMLVFCWGGGVYFRYVFATNCA
jgi:hypothetical protein